MKKNLLYITKLERCAARHLRRAHIAGDTAIVRDPMPWRDMFLCGLASMESETEADEGVTTDPSVAGFKRIPNIQEKARRLLQKYAAETAEPIADYEEVKE